MIFFILRRLSYGILVLLGVITLVFLIFSINPGDPSRMLLDERADEKAVAAVQRELGLDLPLFQQYLFFLNDVSPVSVHHSNPDSRIYFDPDKYNGIALLETGNTILSLKEPYLRRSYQTRRDVVEIIAEALPGTIILAVTAIIIAVVLGLIIGIFSALNKNSLFDRSSLVIAVMGMSAPSFFAAILISWLGGYLWHYTTNLPAIPFVFFLLGVLACVVSSFGKNKKLNFLKVGRAGAKGFFAGILVWIIAVVISGLTGLALAPITEFYLFLPGTGLNMTGSLYDIDVFEGPYLAPQNLILPALTLGIRPLGVIVQLTRSSFLDVMSQDYIRTAKAKGLDTTKIVWLHALRNALNPVVTAVSGWFASMLAGAVFVEFIFNWKGLGLQVFMALENEDFPVVMGAVLVIAFTFVIINILVDILYGILDPRIRTK